MNSRPLHVAPSILSADFRSLGKEVALVQEAGADRIHCDVMDGQFVPNLTFGPLVIAAVKKCVSIPLDVHLMIATPERFINAFCEAGADILIVHAEACTDLPAAIDAIHRHGIRAGVSVNPDGDISLITPYLAQIDQVLVMTVNPGFGGQAFIPEMTSKINAVHQTATAQGLCPDIEVDGGINADTARMCAQNGATVFVAGSYVFGSNDYRNRIESIRREAQAGARMLNS